ncbi:hypothetical protein [Azospirillum doebereinerae]|uniref:Uncharacterized protein n=1 Tax=Azospirillum doebereinerae TaxID=92933 RepID=A0A433J4W8_9PROT|nr:hypothetical protein [Azospirillum doebereinerae]RUQ67460.1 hypothetical protein EJ913_19755 [Azospirillum doebereinerae]
MLPVSTKDVIPFTPLVDHLAILAKLRDRAEADAEREAFGRLIDATQAEIDAAPQPVFRLGIASHFTRAAFRRDLKAAGTTYPGDVALYRALREDLKEVAPYNLDDLLALIDEVEAASQGEVDPTASDRLETIKSVARSCGGRFAALEGDRDFFIAVAPLIACRHFLLGWEGIKAEDGSDAPFVRRRDLTTDATLAHLSEEELQAVGFKIMSLMRPSKDLEKNSASPSRSASSRKPSPTAKTKRLTAPRGSSSANASSGTPAST